MALACGTCVSGLYYNQPLLGDLAAYFAASPDEVSWVAIASQAGYCCGLLAFLPLGDIRERRRLVVGLMLASAVLTLATGLAPSLPLLIAGSLLSASTAVGAQILIPLAVDMARPGTQGRAVGVMIAGLLSGMLLGRVGGGVVGDLLGWRAVYGLAALGLIAVAALLHRGLPPRPPSLRLSYAQVMRSLLHVVRSQPRLWRPTLVGACSFATFNAFWTTLSFLMADHFHRGATEAGLFAFVGLAGALASPWAGKLADRRGRGTTVVLALSLGLAAFATMGWWVSITGLVIGALLMDVGVQSLQVAEQGGVLSLLPEARSRLNTIFMVARFGGGAFGSFVGATAWTHGGWTWVCGSAFGLTLLALTLHFAGRRLEALLGAKTAAG